MALLRRQGLSFINVLAAVSIIFFVTQQYIILDPRNNSFKDETFVVDLDKPMNNSRAMTTLTEKPKSEDCVKVDLKNETATTTTTTDIENVTDKDADADDKSTKKADEGPADGSFNSFPIYHRKLEDGWHSNVHCIGDNFSEMTWQSRSCHFQNLCFDTEEMTYVLFTSSEQIELEKALQHEELDHFSPASSMKTTVSIGGINPKWGRDVGQVEWYPILKPVEEIQSTGYYSLGSDAVLVPYHSLAGFNPGHLVWDDFLPIYTLLTGFGLLDREMVLIRQHYEPALWATCQRQWRKCRPILNKFYPLMGTTLEKTSTQNDTVVEINEGGEKKSKYVCSPNGAAGLGMLTDHGLKLHGWRPKDYESSHNHGRSASLYSFRNWMMRNVGVEPESAKIHNPPYRIIFSIGSSQQPNRRASFKKQSKLVKEKLGDKYSLDIVEVRLSDMSLQEQLELVKDASIFVTICGGGAVTAMFLPRGAAVFSYFNEMDGDGETPARLDWDLLNNMGHLRTHWLPRAEASTSKNGKFIKPEEQDYDAFVKLVEHELDVISHTNDY